MAAGDQVKNILTRKFGPLPGWAWLVIAAGAYFVYSRYISPSTTSTSTAGTAGAGTTASSASQEEYLASQEAQDQALISDMTSSGYSGGYTSGYTYPYGYSVSPGNSGSSASYATSPGSTSSSFTTTPTAGSTSTGTTAATSTAASASAGAFPTSPVTGSLGTGVGQFTLVPSAAKNLQYQQEGVQQYTYANGVFTPVNVSGGKIAGQAPQQTFVRITK